MKKLLTIAILAISMRLAVLPYVPQIIFPFYLYVNAIGTYSCDSDICVIVTQVHEVAIILLESGEMMTGGVVEKDGWYEVDVGENGLKVERWE